MLYTQTTENIKAIVFTLDGGLLDLNRLRYNYYRTTCQNYNLLASKEDFCQHLGNMYTMYNPFLLEKHISLDDYIKMSETDLFEYTKRKNFIKKPGVDEILHYCRQKGIYVCVYTTHKTKRAMQYLQLCDIYDKVDFLIGADSRIEPLPSSQTLETICSQLHIKPKDMLVVANFESMVDAANNIFSNVIYIPDLTPINDTIIGKTYKVAQNYLELMNILLFSKYDDVTMFSQVLGMNENMDYETLTKTKNQLLEKYASDPSLVSLVNRIYDTYNARLLKVMLEEIKKEKEQEEKEEVKEEIIEEVEIKEEKVEKVEEIDKDAIIQPIQQDMTVKSIIEDYKQVEEDTKSTKSLLSTSSIEKEKIQMLLDEINGTEPEEKEEVEEEEVQEGKLAIMAYNCIWSLLVSIIISLTFMLIHIVSISYLPESNVFSQYEGMFYTKVLDMLYGLADFIQGLTGGLLQSFFEYPYAIFILATVILFIIILLIRCIKDALTKD